MNITVATLKSAIANPTTPADRRESALSQLRALAGNPNDPRATDALLVLRELGQSDNGQAGEQACPAAGQSDDSYIGNGPLSRQDEEEVEQYFTGGHHDETLSSEAIRAVEALTIAQLGCHEREKEPIALARLKELHKSSKSEFIRQKSFRTIAWLSHFSENPRASRPAKSYIESFKRDQQVSESGGIRFLPEPLLLDHARQITNPLEHTGDEWVLEAARRCQLYPRSLGRRILHADYLSVKVPELGKPKAGSDAENLHELHLLFGCPEKEAVGV